MSSVMEIAMKEMGHLIELAKANLKVLPGPIVNVSGYGAVGDGVSNDTIVVQSAIDYAILNGMKAVFFPRGTNGQYYVTTLTNANQVVLFGDNASFVGGYTGTILQLGEGGVTPAEFAALEADVIALEGNINTLEDETVTGYKNVVTGFGADPTGLTDSTSAIQAAINAATTDKHAPVFFPVGQYLINGTITLHEGIMLLGAGSQGSTQQYGVTFIHASTGDLFVWDGNGASAAGTGGGLRNALIIKKTGFQGGNAIKLYATDDSHRPGEMVLENILIYGSGTGMWGRGLLIDGTNCNTAQTIGLRSVQLTKFRVAGCQTDNQYIYINQGVHINGSYIGIDSASGAGIPGMTFDGQAMNCALTSLDISGNVIINGSCTDINLQGFATGFQNNVTACKGTAVLSGITSKLINKSTSFKIVSEKAPYVLVRSNTTASNVTGDLTPYIAAFDTTITDTNADMTTTSRFTASVAGIYEIDAALLITGLLNTHTRIEGYVNRYASGGGAALNGFIDVSSPYAQASANAQFTQKMRAVVTLNYGDYIEIAIIVSGGTKVVNVLGLAGSTMYSWMSAKLQQ